MNYKQLMEHCKETGRDSHELARKGGRASARKKTRVKAFKAFNDQPAWYKED
jgi:hypothetical protein